MSYCRFSSNDFMCDLYCYADVHGGYTTHVAGNRLIPKEPIPPKVEFTKKNLKVWTAREAQVKKILDKARRVGFRLPHAGQTFNDPTLEEFLKRVISLQVLGYRCPSYVVDRIIDEIKDEEMLAATKAIMKTRYGKYKHSQYRQGWRVGRDAAITAVMRRRGR